MGKFRFRLWIRDSESKAQRADTEKDFKRSVFLKAKGDEQLSYFGHMNLLGTTTKIPTQMSYHLSSLKVAR